MDNTSTRQHPRSQSTMTKSTRLFAAPVVVLVALALVAMATSAAEPAPGTGPAPYSKIDLGTYSLETYANVTRHQDRLRHSKSYYKAVIRNKLLPDSSPLFTFKITDIAELIRCENITLEQPEMEPLVDCRPLESYVLSDGIQVPVDQSKRNVLYAYRQSIKLKQRSAFTRDDRAPAYGFAYYLREDEVMRRIQAHQEGVANFKEQDFGGVYMEVINGRVKCSLNFLFGINSTGLKPFVETPSGDQGAFIESVLDSFADFSNGATACIEDLKCVDTTSALPIALHGHLKLIQQQEYPYLSLSHKMFTHPFSQFFNFESQVTQSRDESNPTSDAYNTTIKIDSLSGLFDALNFKLDQVFVNEDAKTGWEEMNLAHLNFVALVRANWSVDTLIKNLVLFETAKGGAVDTKPFFAMRYEDQPHDDDMLTFSMSFKRSLLKNLFSDSQAVDLEQQSENWDQRVEL